MTGVALMNGSESTLYVAVMGGIEDGGADGVVEQNV